MSWQDLRVQSNTDWPGEARAARVRSAVIAAVDGWAAAARSLQSGNEYLAEWADAVAVSRPVVASIRRSVEAMAPYYSDRRVPTSGPEADEFASTTWRGMPGATIPEMVELGWRLTLADAYEAARVEWAAKVAQFAADAAAETASAAAELGGAVSVLSDDVAAVGRAVATVAGYVDIPPDVAATLESELARVAQNRAAAVDVLRSVVDRLLWVERTVTSGDVDAFDGPRVGGAVLPLAAAGITLLLAVGKAG